MGPRAGDIIEHIQRLGSMHITCHTQLVLCPPLTMAHTLTEASGIWAALRPIVESISVVPVGLTKYNNMIKTVTCRLCATIQRRRPKPSSSRSRQHQRQFEAEDGDGYPFVYLSMSGIT